MIFIILLFVQINIYIQIIYNNKIIFPSWIIVLAGMHFVSKVATHVLTLVQALKKQKVFRQQIHIFKFLQRWNSKFRPFFLKFSASIARLLDSFSMSALASVWGNSIIKINFLFGFRISFASSKNLASDCLIFD